jgi:hypothetical protein
MLWGQDYSSFLSFICQRLKTKDGKRVRKKTVYLGLALLAVYEKLSNTPAGAVTALSLDGTPGIKQLKVLASIPEEDWEQVIFEASANGGAQRHGAGTRRRRRGQRPS